MNENTHKTKRIFGSDREVKAGENTHETSPLTLGSKVRNEMEPADKLNRSIHREEFLKSKVGAPMSSASLAAGNTLTRQTADIGEDENSAGYTGMKEYGGLFISEALNIGAGTDRATVAGNVYRKMLSSDWKALDIFIPETAAAEAAGIVDKHKVTYGDISAFERLKKHASEEGDISVSEYIAIRDKVNASRNGGAVDYAALGQNSRLKKRIDSIVDASKINAFEEIIRARVNDPEFRSLFTPEELKKINTEDAILLAKTEDDYRVNTNIIDKVLKSKAKSDPRFAALEFDKLSPGHTKKILKGRMEGLMPDANSAVEMGLIAKKTLNESLSENTSIKSGGIFKFAKSKAAESLSGDENYEGMQSGMSSFSRGISGAAKGAYYTGSLSEAAIYEGGALAGNFIAARLDKVGAEGAADTLRAAGKKYQDIRKTPKKAKEKVSEAVKKPFELIGLSLSFVGKKIGETKIGGFLQQNKVIKSINKTLGRTKTALSAPFKTLNRIFQSVSKTIVRPAIMLLGALVIIEAVVMLMSGGGGSTSSVAVLFLDSEEHLADFQTKYDSLDDAFIAQVSAIINGYASTTNLKGESIHYGVNTSTVTSGGFSTSAQYKNGVTLTYYADGVTTAGISSNIENCLSALAIIMQQEQEEHHAEALELLEAIYMSTHSYSYIESALYGCDSGCEVTHYYCSEAQTGYQSTDMRYSPWLYGELFSEQKTCDVCSSDPDMSPSEYTGCTVTGTCYHDDGVQCDNCEAVYRTVEHSSSYTDPDTGDVTTETDYEEVFDHWECQGHDHYGCPDGHDVITCFGHVDINMSVYIASLNRIYEMGGVPVNEDA